MMYSIYIVKATRKPFLWNEEDVADLLEAKDIGWTVYSHIKKLQSIKLCASGISVQIVESLHKDEIAKIEIGGLNDFNVLHMIGNW